MANPKFININGYKEEKSQFNFRLSKALVNDFQELAKLKNIPATELLTDLLNSYLEDKVLTNTYLDLMGNTIIKVPESLYLKSCITVDPKDLDGNTQAANKVEEILRKPNLIAIEDGLFRTYLDRNDKELKIGNIISLGLETSKETKEDVLNTIQEYAVLLFPNNLDKFDKELESYNTMIDNSYGHSGIEFLIIPEAAKYTDDYLDCLYIFYFRYDRCYDGALEVYLLDNIEAAKVIGDNEKLKTLGAALIYKLGMAKTIEDVKEIAKTYNTGNIIKVPGIDPEIEPEVNKITANYLENINKYSLDTLIKGYEELKEYLEEMDKKIEELEDKLKNG